MVFTSKNDAFQESGFLVCEPGVLDPKSISLLKSASERLLPAWQDGFHAPIGASVESIERAPIFQYGHVVLEGCSLSRRKYVRTAQPKLEGDSQNWLYGRQSRLDTPYWDIELATFSQDTILHRLACDLLGAEALNLLGGSLIKSYPGYTGHDGRYFSSIHSFLSDAQVVVKPCQRSILTLIILIDDADETLSPLALIPDSHRQYEVIKRKQIEAYGGDVLGIRMAATRGIYQEILPLDTKPESQIKAKAGSVVCLDGTTCYKYHANMTTDKTRSALVLHVANRQYPEFFGDYSADPRACAEFVDRYPQNAHSFVSRTFVEISQHPKFVLKTRGGLKARVAAGVKTLRNQVGVKRLMRYSNRRFFHPFLRALTPKKINANIGAGRGWSHPAFLTVDIWPGSDIIHNLVAGDPLPFQTASVSSLYTSHCIEHLRDVDVQDFFKESSRILEKGGVLRVTCPDMDLYFDAYDRRDLSFFRYHLDRELNRYDSWLRFLVRMFAEPVVDSYSDEQLSTLYRTLSHVEFRDYFMKEIAKLDRQFVAEFLPNQHKSWWTPKKLSETLLDCGFSETYVRAPNESAAKEMRNPKYFDTNNPSKSLRVEAIK